MSVSGIDFSFLSLRDAFDLAILIEDEARERYEEFAHQMELHHTPGAAEFFRLMANNEAKHGAWLGQQRGERFGDEPRVVTRAMLWDVEAPDYDQARAFMTAREAMHEALQCEEKAHAFFVAALPQVHEPAVAALFVELRDEEVQHQILVKNEIAKLPPDPAVRPDDFEDEPTAQ
jgi:erythrin-vacuolar iron transport family protein